MKTIYDVQYSYFPGFASTLSVNRDYKNILKKSFMNFDGETRTNCNQILC